jgi:hypothetical protein
MIRKRVSPLLFFRKEGINLYPVLEKRPGQYINGVLVGLKNWEELEDFSKLSKDIRIDDNIGFRTGVQYSSGKIIIGLDFDNNSSKGLNNVTLEMYNRFESLDSNNKIGFYESSTCGNYGVLLDITNINDLRMKIDEVSRINKHKIDVDNLEILYNSNMVLPPSKTSCKEHKTKHRERKFINNNIGFCVPNDDQIKFLIDKIDNFIKDNRRKRLENDSELIIDMSIDVIEVRRIGTNKMLGILECLKEDRFLEKYPNWIKLLYMVVNSNNSEEVIKKFWERCKVGIYSSVTLEHIKSFFTSCQIEPNFNNAPLWSIAMSDNPELYDKIFNKYDEPMFEYNKINFKDKNGKNTKYLNYEQIIEYFKKDNKITNLNVICSGLGTGKTSFIEKRIRDNLSNARIIFITMRQSLAYSLMIDFKKLGFKNYLNKNSNVNYYSNRIIISLDSIDKLILKNEDGIRIPSYDIVICDEIASLLSHLSYQNIKNIEETYKIFTDIIKNGKECYFMDGDISNREISWLKEYIGYSQPEQKLPLFNAEKGSQYKLILSYCTNGQYNKIIKDLDEGKNICIVCMSATESEKLYNLLNQKYKCLLIISKTGDKQKKELENINNLVTLYRCFIYSPTITVGVNIDCIHFDKIYGYICDGSVCPRDYYQMLSRVRNPKNNIIHILIGSFDMQFHGLHNVIPFECYKKSLYNNDKIDGLSYVKLWNKWENDHKALWLDIFKWYANVKGHILTIEKSTKELFDIEKAKFKENIERLELNINILPVTVEDIYNAKTLNNYKIDKIPDKISNNERDLICNKPILTEEDKIILDKIDRDNGWDNTTIIQERLKQNIANSYDKARLEKMVYINTFGFNNVSTLEDYKDVYNKIPIIINNAKFNNIQNIQDLLSIAPVDNKTFDELLISRKTEYIKKLFDIFKIKDFNKDNLINEIDYKKIKYFIDDKTMNIVFGIINTDKGTKELKIKKDSSDIQNMNIIKKILNEYGYNLHSKQKKVNGIKKYVYNIKIIDAVKRYMSNQNSLTSFDQITDSHTEYVF